MTPIDPEPLDVPTHDDVQSDLQLPLAPALLLVKGPVELLVRVPVLLLVKVPVLPLVV